MIYYDIEVLPAYEGAPVSGRHTFSYVLTMIIKPRFLLPALTT